MCGCCDAIQNGTVYEIFYEMFPAHDQAANISFLPYTGNISDQFTCIGQRQCQ